MDLICSLTILTVALFYCCLRLPMDKHRRWLLLFITGTGLILYTLFVPPQPSVIYAKNALFLLCSIYGALEDLHSRTVPRITLWGVAAAGVFANSHWVGSLLWGSGILLVFLVLAALSALPFPGGDMKYLCVCGVFFGDFRVLLGLFAGCFAALLHLLALRVLLHRPFPESVPFLPYLSAGYFLCLFIP